MSITVDTLCTLKVHDISYIKHLLPDSPERKEDISGTISYGLSYCGTKYSGEHSASKHHWAKMGREFPVPDYQSLPSKSWPRG